MDIRLNSRLNSNKKNKLVDKKRVLRKICGKTFQNEKTTENYIKFIKKKRKGR